MFNFKCDTDAVNHHNFYEITDYVANPGQCHRVTVYPGRFTRFWELFMYVGLTRFRYCPPETVFQLLRRRVNAQQPGRGVPSSCRESGRHVSLFLAIASV